MVVTLAQDHLEDQEIELQRQEVAEEGVEEQRFQVEKATIFLRLEEENQLGEEVAEVELQERLTEEAEIKDKAEKEEIKNEMVRAESLLVVDERQMEEVKENLVVHRTEQSLAEAKERAVEPGDAPMKSSRPVLMFAPALMPRYLVHVLRAALRDAKRGGQQSNNSMRYYRNNINSEHFNYFTLVSHS